MTKYIKIQKESELYWQVFYVYKNQLTQNINIVYQHKFIHIYN